MSLQKIVNEYYDFQVVGFIRLSQNVYKVKTEKKFYCLKIVESKKLEIAYNHILTLKLQHFVCLISNIQNHYFTNYQDKYFYIMEYLSPDKDIKKEIKLKAYYQYLSYLHNHSFFFQHIQYDFVEQQKQDLFSIIQERKNNYEDLMKQFEIMRFRSPSGWMLVLNYYRLMEYFHQAYHYLNDYYELMREKSEIRLSLTYNHFCYEHIYVYEDKLVSIDNMQINFCIYDIFDMFQAVEPFYYDFDSLFGHYLEKVQLLKEEKVLLCCLLSIVPTVHFTQDEEHNILEMSKVVCYLDCVNRIIKKLKIDC